VILIYIFCETDSLIFCVVPLLYCQLANIPLGLVEELHHTIRQRYRQALATFDEGTTGGPKVLTEGVAAGFVAAGGGTSKLARKDELHRAIFIKPAPVESYQERKSLLGLDR